MNTKPTYQELEKEVKELREKLSKIKNEDYFKELVKNNTDAFLVIDIQGNIIFKSESNATTLGYTQEERIGKNAFERMYPDDRNKMMKAMKAGIKKTGITEKISFRAYHKNGSIKYFEGTAKNMIHSPIVNGIIINYRNVTERKKAEQALIASEEKYKHLSNQFQLMSDNIPDLVWAKDLDSNFTFVNKSTCDKLLIAEDIKEPIGKNDIFFAMRQRNLHPDRNDWHTFGELCINSDVDVINSKKPERFDEYGNVKGEFLYLDVYKAPIFDEAAKMVGTVGHGRIVTKEKAAEKALKESEKRLSQTMMASNDGMWDWNLKTNNVFFDARYYQMAGYEPNEFPYKFEEFQKRVHPDDINFVLDQAQKHINGETERFFAEFRFKKKNGDWFWIMGRGLIVERDENNKPLQFIGTHTDISDRKQAEEIILELKDFNESIVNNLTEGIILESEEGIIQFANPAMLKMLGYKDDELVGKNWKCLVPKNKIDIVNNANKRRYEGKSDQYEMELVKKNGEKIFVLVGGVPTIIKGIYSGLLAAFTDITKRKQAEEELIKAKEKAEENEYKFRSMFENTQIGILYCNAEGKILEANQVMLDILGSPSIEATLKINLLTFKPLRDNGFAQNVEKCISEKNIVTEDTVYTSKWGKTVFMKYYLVPVILNNKVIGVWANLNNLTDLWDTQNELKKAKEKAEENEYKVRSMFENTQIGILYCNAEGKILEANQVMLDILGSPSIETTLKINLLKFKPLRDNGFAQNVEKCISEKNIVTEDTVYTSKWGKTIFMKYYLVPVILNNKVIGVWANLNNLTDLWDTQNELKKAKEKAQESDRLKSAFLANMSHEIRTPMNAILGFGSFLKDPELSTEKRNYFVDIINRSGNHLLNLINDIVDISKIDAGQMTVIETECKLNEFLFEIYQIFHSAANSKEKQLEISIKKSLLDGFDIILTDTTRLRQILINLVGNAVKFTKKGSVEIKYLITENNEIEFSVKDSGIGISEKELPIIFKRFRQADETSTENYGGTGLGLAISKACVELLGGKIWVKSKHGKGSTFSFTTPYKPVNMTTTDKKTIPANSDNVFVGKTILIVEDEPFSCLILEEMLGHTGATIEKATDGKQAIYLCKHKPEIDIVLMDNQLPYIDGLSATKEILKDRPNLPIILQTANAMQNDREKSIQAGCVDYITKPINKKILISTIIKHIH